MSKVANFCAVAVALLAALAGTYIYTINQVSPRIKGDAVVPVARARQLPWHNYSGTDLTGKVALVTGGSTGIGRAVAVELYKLGADVVITSRSERRASAAAAAIENEDKTSSGSVTGMSLQLASNANVRAFVAKFKAEVLSSGRLLTFLVENAGMTPNIGTFSRVSMYLYLSIYLSIYLRSFCRNLSHV